MLTQCPNCQSIYQLDAADLSAAHGFVECGECDTQFSALERLSDDPDDFQPRAQPDPQRTDHVDAGEFQPTSSPAFVLLDTLEDPRAQSDPEPIADESHEANSIQETEADAISGTASGTSSAEDDRRSASTANRENPMYDSRARQRLSESEHAILFSDPGVEVEQHHDSQSDGDIDDVPAVLKEELARLNQTQRGTHSHLWIILAILFAVVLCAQLAWLFRDTIVARHPAAYPYYTSACAVLACRLAPRELPNAIELVSRDVRDHPQFRDTLLVNATLVSRSDTVTYFPTIQLGLYAQTGEAIGVRRFAPSEYLDKSIDLESGMPPNRPVYVVMEIAGVSAKAVSFEFKFL